MLSRLRAAVRRRMGEVSPDAPSDAHLDACPAEELHHFDEPRLPLQPGGIPVPNRRLRASSGTADLAMFLGIGEAWAHLVSGFLPDRPAVLDLGCGCGKLARFLALRPDLRYLGVDLYGPSILWCRRAFAPHADRFAFEHFNGRSAHFNPGGDVAVQDYRLPTGSGAMDMVVCGSLFTHLFEADARHYLAEIARVLKPGGRALLSLHVDVAPGETWSGTEVRVDVDEAHFLAACAQAGLAHEQAIGAVYGQAVHLLSRAG
jgi:SAM-dependent methyltransferase